MEGTKCYFINKLQKYVILFDTDRLLPLYSNVMAQGQELMYEMNQRNVEELFIALEYLHGGAQDLKAIITSRRISIFQGGKESSPILEFPLRFESYI